RKALAGCERLRERCASLLCIAVAGATPASSASLNVGSHVLAFRADFPDRSLLPPPRIQAHLLASTT
ncbi:MAG: hypothetical protein AAGI08_04510, partial [Bacteroidota bacterium]